MYLCVFSVYVCVCIVCCARDSTSLFITSFYMHDVYYTNVLGGLKEQNYRELFVKHWWNLSWECVRRC